MNTFSKQMDCPISKYSHWEFIWPGDKWNIWKGEWAVLQNKVVIFLQNFHGRTYATLYTALYFWLQPACGHQNCVMPSNLKGFCGCSCKSLENLSIFWTLPFTLHICSSLKTKTKQRTPMECVSFKRLGSPSLFCPQETLWNIGSV